MQNKTDPFIFEISLTILDHLGRNLYRNFVTILGEAISNSWDADAKNVWIYVENDNFIIKDDVNTREYAKYVLREGTPLEKRELLGHLRSRLVLNDKRITLLEE
jgi:hypothetical protein